ncbi:putative F-box protein At3g16210 [Coffea arabica]|uniref:F-box protein At3g16210 n=1 Tax=Coffea arabica TaxID=13443 RepID=A0ABM4W8E4_COFAR
MSDYIPNHLLANVLLRLPFDSLLQPRRVSKSWRALIDSSDFIKIHLNKVYQEANFPSGIKIIGLNQNNFYTLVLDLEADSSSITASAKQLNCPSDYSGSEVCLKGSCNGLLCLMYLDTNKIILWNPWIQKSWELPSFPIEYHTRGRAIFHLGFGYDRVNDEYKVFNRIRFSDLCDRDQSNCVLVDGALHWFMRERRLNGVIYIISFDLSSEEFQKMPCPMIPWPLGYFQHNLKVLNGSLCLYYDVGG